MRIEVRRKAGVAILHLAGRLTLGHGDTELRSEFDGLLEAGERALVLNLFDLDHLDSAGVGETVACYKRASERGAVIKVVLRAGSRTADVFEISGLDRVFELFDDEASAVASFPGGWV